MLAHGVSSQPLLQGGSPVGRAGGVAQSSCLGLQFAVVSTGVAAGQVVALAEMTVVAAERVVGS